MPRRCPHTVRLRLGSSLGSWSLSSSSLLLRSPPIEAQASTVSTCRPLVEDGLVACGQVSGPVASVYRWRGEVEEAVEWRALLKTTHAALPQVMDRLIDEHPGELPELATIDLISAWPEYARWVHEVVDPSSQSSLSDVAHAAPGPHGDLRS